MSELLAGPLASPTPPEHAPVVFPLTWLLANASAPIQYRAICDVVGLENMPKAVAHLPYATETGLAIAITQSLNGSWNESMLTTPGTRSGITGLGTIPAVGRLLEYGWSPDAPPLHQARRILFRLLALDSDPEFAFELVPRRGADAEAVPRSRALLREASAAVLAQSGHTKDPRVRGAATRIVAPVNEFLRSPLVESPLMRVGNQHVIHPEAAPPSIWMLMMLAYMPLFRTENFELMDRLATYLSHPGPRTNPCIAVDREIIPTPHLLLGDPLTSVQAAQADMPWALFWLELVARLGFLQKNESWSNILDRLLAHRDNDHVWRSKKSATAPRSDNPFTWAMFPLEDDLTGEKRWTDVNLRLGLIAKLAGRPITPA